ncbi:MAG: hypothetical protein WC747_04495, partial [Candidatus Babeliales bacterium]
MKHANLLSKFFIIFTFVSCSGFVFSSEFTVLEDGAKAFDEATGTMIEKTADETAVAFAERIASFNAELTEGMTADAVRTAAQDAGFTARQATEEEITKLSTQVSQEALTKGIADQGSKLAEEEFGGDSIRASRKASQQAEEDAATKSIAEQEAESLKAATENARRSAAGVIDDVAVKRVAAKLSDLNDAELEVSKANDAISDMGKALKKAARKLSKAMVKNDVKGMKAAQAEMKAAKDALTEATSSLKSKAATDMVDSALDSSEKMLGKMDKAFADAGGEFAADGTTLKSMSHFSDEAAAALDKSVGDADKIIEDSSMAQKNAMDAIDAERGAAAKGVTDAEYLSAKFKSKSLLQDATRFKNAFTEMAGKAGSMLPEVSLETVGGAAGAAAKKVGGKLLAAGELLISAVLFMVPNIFESAFLAQKQRQVQLQTLAQPIQFGDWVLQIPDSCFNWTNPSATLPIYVRIPVAKVDDTISQADLAHFTIPGSTTNYSIGAKPQLTNTVSTKIQSSGARLFSFGSDLDMQPISRYTIKESSYYSHAGIVTSFAPPASFTPPASSALTSSQFTGLVVDLNSGYVMDASGEANSPVSLIAPIDPHNPNYQAPSPASVKDFLPSELSKLEMAGLKVTYTQYADTGTGTKGPQATPSLITQFKCKCIGESEENNVTVATGNVSTCSTGECLLSKSLSNYMSGLSINALVAVGPNKVTAATASNATTDTTTETEDQAAAMGLGSVAPMFGWG